MIFQEIQTIFSFFMWILLVAAGLALVSSLCLDWTKPSRELKGAVSGVAMVFVFAVIALVVI